MAGGWVGGWMNACDMCARAGGCKVDDLNET